MQPTLTHVQNHSKGEQFDWSNGDIHEGLFVCLGAFTERVERKGDRNTHDENEPWEYKICDCQPWVKIDKKVIYV